MKKLLQLPLAMCIVKIRRTTGKETTDKILRILAHDRFNNSSFREEYGSVGIRDRRTEEVVEECINKVMGVSHLEDTFSNRSDLQMVKI